MSRLILYLCRTLEPPPPAASIEVYGLTDDGTPVTVTVIAVDPDQRGITVQFSGSTFGCQIWHFDLDQVK